MNLASCREHDQRITAWLEKSQVISEKAQTEIWLGEIQSINRSPICSDFYDISDNDDDEFVISRLGRCQLPGRILDTASDGLA